MAVEITWTLRNQPHTGSTELNGVPNRPIAYQHPQDRGGAPMTSGFSGWNYSQRDYTNDNVVAASLGLNIRGRTSYWTYQQLRQLAQNQLANLPKPWRGQQDATRVFGYPLATELQPSGFVAYDARASMNPPGQGSTIVSLDASGWCFGMSFSFPGGGTIGFGRSVTSNSKIGNGESTAGLNVIAETRARCRVQRVFDVRFGITSARYDVTIPAGGSIRVGEISTGLGYTIKGGANSFLNASFPRFRVGVVGDNSIQPPEGD